MGTQQELLPRRRTVTPLSAADLVPAKAARSTQSAATGHFDLKSDEVRWIINTLEQGLMQGIFTGYIASTSSATISEALESDTSKLCVFIAFFLWALGYAIFYYRFFARQFKRGKSGCGFPMRYFLVLRATAGSLWVLSGILLAAVGPARDRKAHNTFTGIEESAYFVTESTCIIVHIYDTLHFEEQKEKLGVPFGFEVKSWVRIRWALIVLEIAVIIAQIITMSLFFAKPPGCEDGTRCDYNLEYAGGALQTAFQAFFVLE